MADPKDPFEGLTDNQAAAEKAIGSAIVAQDGADTGKTMGYIQPVVNQHVDTAVDYLKSNTAASPENLSSGSGYTSGGGGEGGGGQTSNDGGTGSDCIK